MFAPSRKILYVLVIAVPLPLTHLFYLPILRIFLRILEKGPRITQKCKSFFKFLPKLTRLLRTILAGDLIDVIPCALGACIYNGKGRCNMTLKQWEALVRIRVIFPNSTTNFA